MSKFNITGNLTIWCDYCNNWSYLENQTIRKANNEARQKGWRIGSYRNQAFTMCPICREKATQETMIPKSVREKLNK